MELHFFLASLRSALLQQKDVFMTKAAAELLSNIFMQLSTKKID